MHQKDFWASVYEITTTVLKAKTVAVALLQNLAYLSSFEIHVPAFSSAQLALTAASVVPLKKQTEIEDVWEGKVQAFVSASF